MSSQEIHRQLNSNLKKYGSSRFEETGGYKITTNHRRFDDSSVLLDMAQTASRLSHQLIGLYNQQLLNSRRTTPASRTRRLTPLSSGYNSARTSRENLLDSSYSSVSSSSLSTRSYISSSSFLDADLEESEFSLVRGRLVFEDIDEEKDENKRLEEETPARYSSVEEKVRLLTGVKLRHDQAAKMKAKEMFGTQMIDYSSVAKSLDFSS